MSCALAADLLRARKNRMHVLRTYVMDVTTEHVISSHECPMSDWSCILDVTCFFLSVFAKPHFNIFEFTAALASKVPAHVAAQATWIVRRAHVWGFQPTGSQTLLKRALPVSLSSGSWLCTKSNVVSWRMVWHIPDVD